ncbi:MAG: hypothetical protein ABIO72_04210 [Patescibacteria group bacterium]
MASQATHVILAEMVFDEYFSHFSKQKFILGTMFPDIRYLGVVTREQTHIQSSGIKQIQEEPDAFLAGMKFHNLVDLVREDFMRSKQVYTYCPEFKYVTQSLKLLEDERYYSHINSWDGELAYLADVVDEERRFSISDAFLEKWHEMLRDYLQAPPTDASRAAFLTELKFSPETINAMKSFVDVLRGTIEVVHIIDEFIAAFPELLRKP